jgi:hypothetical protein
MQALFFIFIFFIKINSFRTRFRRRLSYREDTPRLFPGLVTRHQKHYSSFSIIDPNLFFPLATVILRGLTDPQRYRYRAGIRYQAKALCREGDEKGRRRVGWQKESWE